MAAQRVSWGARVTDRLGDLSYGMYIFAFPVQQMVVALGRSRGWTFATHLSLSLLVTSVLAYVSWHALEKRILRFKPQRKVFS
jgi:peptidoglycan/LPS O-acetylase OafA/YrhL